MNDRLPEAARADAPLRLGGCVLDLAAGELRSADRLPVALRRQALELLLILGRHAGEVVSKDELMNRLWGRAEVGETSLAQAVADVRRALGDSGHRLVRNVARRGYMLVPNAEAAEPTLLSIAVLPITIEGDAQGLDWLVEALHGDLIAELSRTPGSLLIAAETMRTFRDRSVDPRSLAGTLNVRYVARGRLRPLGPRLMLTLELIDGRSGGLRHLERIEFERASLTSELLALAVRVERQLSSAVIFDAVEQRRGLSTTEVGADDLAMKAVALTLRRLDAATFAQAQVWLDEAVALDPGCVRAWGAMPYVGVHTLLNGWTNEVAAVRQRIDEAARQLERLAPDGFLTRQARMIQAHERRDWTAFLRLASELAARELRPGPHAGLAWALLLNGRPEDAIAPAETALRLSPLDAMRAEWQYRIALAHFMLHRDDLASEWALTAELSNPSLPWPPLLAACLWRLGRHDAAREAWASHRARHPGWRPEHLERRLPDASPRIREAREAMTAQWSALVASV